MMTTEATCARLYEQPPQHDENGCPTWLTRGANFVVAVSQVHAGSRLERVGDPDEHMVFLPDVGATIVAGSERVDAGAESVTIVPPGASAITAAGDGHIVRLFTARSTDLAALAGNAGVYEHGAPGVAPWALWPDPPAGFRLRSYRVADYNKPGSNMRLFRCTGLMINVLQKREVPRDVTKLSPHTHTDFEQGSLAVQGTYVHHLRWPWTPDMRAWRDDLHAEMASPSLLVVPPGVVHTSRNITAPGWLIDLFAPPRLDFSAKPGLVCNADEYPTPPGVDLAAYAAGPAA